MAHHRFTSSARGRRAVPLAALMLPAVLLAAGCGGSSGDSNKDTTAPANANGGATAPASSATSPAKIDSAVTSGTVAAPSVTVKGSGFGPRPAPKPPYSPAGKQGCPDAPPGGGDVDPAAAEGDGHLFGTKLYFTDAKAKKGSYKNWTAGQYTKEFFDCVGLVIDGWTDTQVRFHFGNIYGKVIPQNTYFLSDGDVFKVYVNGATLAGKATLGK